MLKNLKNVSTLDWKCSAMLAAPIIGHDVIFTLFGGYSLGAFFTVKNNF
jgi:hypothetical protein